MITRRLLLTIPILVGTAIIVFLILRLVPGDPAGAILEFATANHVDHIVIGARQGSLTRTLLGSASAKVATEAPCTVTIVRLPPRADEGSERKEPPDDRSMPAI